jgi:TonB family protein
MKLSGLVLLLAWAAAASAAESSPQFAFKPLTQDYYPETARALGQQGTVTVRLCYDEKGKVIASTLEQSSSFEKLDQAAVRMGKAYRIKPDKPGCVAVLVKFSLTESQGPVDHGV